MVKRSPCTIKGRLLLFFIRPIIYLQIDTFEDLCQKQFFFAPLESQDIGGFVANGGICDVIVTKTDPYCY